MYMYIPESVEIVGSRGATARINIFIYTCMQYILCKRKSFKQNANLRH